MVVLGADTHKRNHTVVAADEAGVEIGSTTVGATPEGHLRLVKWARRWPERRWAIEDCRALSRRLEADLLKLGELVVRVPPKMMAGVRRSARTRGKSDPIDALAVARAVLREPDLPVAQLDGPSRELRLLVDYRESLVKDRTAAQNRLRWRLHELEPGYDPAPGSLNRYKTLDQIDQLLAAHTSMVATLGRREVIRIRELTREANQLERDIGHRVTQQVRGLPEIPGLRTTHRRQTGRRSRRHQPVQIPRRLRHVGRNSTHPRLVSQQPTTPAQPRRKPADQRCNPPDRNHPDPHPPRRSNLHQPTTRNRVNQTRSPPTPQTKTRQRRLPDPPQQHPTTRPSRRRLK